MAIELGTKIVKDTITYNDYAIGISLPLQVAGTGFRQTYNTTDQIKSNIKNLLLTQKGERILQPEFGSGLQSILFDFNDDDVATKIEDTINEAFEMWLPYVTIADIVVEQTDELKDRNRVSISLKFQVNGNIDLNEVTFNVQG
jgi:phage baseplate assembly protein W|tara:strand:+ start:86 stop:514 length:429 start_codon:yes stop_codon:yes gene_type:complete